MAALAVLLVDDDAEAWGFLSDIISDLGYRVDVADDGPTALELSRRRPYEALFTKDKPIIFAFHGNSWLIHRRTYPRTNHGNLHVRGYKEGTTPTASTSWRT